MSGIEYIKDEISQHPHCVHGPSFLMARETTKGLRRFFVCSACRDRKDCSFFLWEDDKQKVNTEQAIELLNQKKVEYANINHNELDTLLKQVRNMPDKQRQYCFTCNTFLTKKKHNSSHKITTGVTDHELNYPSTFLTPLENDKLEAQYLFSDSTITTTINILRDLKLTNVLCIGAPRIHEYIQNECTDMKSFLLDFDKRYHNFFGPEKFCWYNMFNNYFFISDAEKNYLKFLKESNTNIVLVIDPPFGGRLEPISQTINAIEQHLKTFNNYSGSLPTLLYFPYFMESHIKNHLQDLQMADYKVNYDNHALFASNEKARKFGSPVRIFTNINLKDFKFEGEEYRFCEFCERYVYKDNKHCFLCSACTSKDGRTYIHCEKCERCVKPTWKHCKECRKCAQPNHKCGQETFNQSCFHCHERGHKKNQCPNINVGEVKRKRQEKHDMRKNVRR